MISLVLGVNDGLYGLLESKIPVIPLVTMLQLNEVAFWVLDASIVTAFVPQVVTFFPAFAIACFCMVIGKLTGVWTTPHWLVRACWIFTEPNKIPAGVGVNCTLVSEMIFKFPALAGTTSHTIAS